MTAPAYLIPLLGAVLLVAGILLLRRGQWPRRTGTTPHCSKCGYNLSSLVTLPDQLPRCPECGTPATPWRIKLGERPIRPSLVWAGGALAILGILSLTSLFSTSLRDFQWIHLEPLGWLLRDLGSQRTSARQRSWSEIMRRENAGLLSEADESKVIDRALQGRALTMDSHDDVIAEYVARRYLDNKLTPAQSDRFFARITDVQLAVRPVVGAQSPLPYVIRSEHPRPGDWQLIMWVSRTQVDDRAPEKPDRPIGYDFGGQLTAEIERHAVTPGVHHLRVRVQLLAAPTATLGTSVDLDNPAPGEHVVTKDLCGNFTVVQGRTPITVLTTPDVSELRRNIDVDVRPANGYRTDLVVVRARADNLPVDAAFTVSIRAGAREYPVGDWIVKRSSNLDTTWVPKEPTVDRLDGAEFVLRSDETLARRTVDLDQVWKGQIVVPVPKRKN